MIDSMIEMMHAEPYATVQEEYSSRHGVDSAAILTVYDDERAWKVAEYIRTRIEGKTVVEIGGGIGLLAFHMAKYAKRIFVIEANPIWAYVHVVELLKNKPKNVTYIFGAACEVDDILEADVAVFCTHSAHDSMRRAAESFTGNVIDIYAEIWDNRKGRAK